MRTIVTYVTVCAALTSCVHHDEPPALMRPTSAPAVAKLKEPAPPPVTQTQESAPQSLSMQMMAGNIEPLQGEDPVLPDQVLLASHGQVLEGAYKMCISSEGKVQSVTPLVSIDGADQCIVEALTAWRFPKLPLTICKTQTLRFEIP